MNDMCGMIFVSAYKPKNGKEPLSSIEGIDGSCLPPCKTFLSQQKARVNCICAIWNNSCESNPPVFYPESNGRQLIDNMCRLIPRD